MLQNFGAKAAKYLWCQLFLCLALLVTMSVRTAAAQHPLCSLVISLSLLTLALCSSHQQVTDPDANGIAKSSIGAFSAGSSLDLSDDVTSNRRKYLSLISLPSTD